MTRIGKLHDDWLQDPEYWEAYDALEEEFALAAALIAAGSQTANHPVAPAEAGAYCHRDRRRHPGK